MILKEHFETIGQKLFRYRSYLPLLFILFILFAVDDMQRLHFSTLNHLVEWLSLAFIVAGLLVRIITVGQAAKGTSGRNTKNQVAKALNTTGFYSVVRHPLYLGNFLIFFGCILLLQVPWLAFLSVTTFWLYYERIMVAEEAYLITNYAESYLQWAENTPAFVPNFKNWQKSEIPFSTKKAIRGEYTTLMATILTANVLILIEDSLRKHEIYFRPNWLYFLAISIFVYLVIRLLKKKTSLLTN
ncbi:MAG: DUF1295 domain-containing protein [Deferribacteres bacterium]|nr:DUF1295 domain-containing protein [candidate division KSB1 bacterium]MCB9503396.1 DUF1295 domain-containing protein [Deferribacteres bacterium]